MQAAVALRKESVDRNRCSYLHSNMSLESLSARRAWIEMVYVLSVAVISSVALRKESVDRNMVRFSGKLLMILSLSARRAWIEISSYPDVRLTKYRRSPQGERG